MVSKEKDEKQGEMQQEEAQHPLHVSGATDSDSSDDEGQLEQRDIEQHIKHKLQTSEDQAEPRRARRFESSMSNLARCMEKDIDRQNAFLDAVSKGQAGSGEAVSREAAEAALPLRKTRLSNLFHTAPTGTDEARASRQQRERQHLRSKETVDNHNANVESASKLQGGSSEDVCRLMADMALNKGNATLERLRTIDPEAQAAAKKAEQRGRAIWEERVSQRPWVQLSEFIDSPGPCPDLDQHRATMAKATFPDGPVITLALDSGGGTRTTTQLEMLDLLMKKLTDHLQLPKGDCLKPSDVFHLIVGSGTGGMIAILLGRLRMSVPEVMDFYKTVEKDLFQPSSKSVFESSTKIKNLMEENEGSLKVKYSFLAGLGEKIATLLKDRESENVLQNGEVKKNHIPAMGNVLVSALESSPGGFVTKKFRSYRCGVDGDHPGDPECSIVEAIMATMASYATVFDQVLKQGTEKRPNSPSMFHNPTELAREEVELVFKNHPMHADFPYAKFLVKIGAGRQDIEDTRLPEKAEDVYGLLNMTTENFLDWSIWLSAHYATYWPWEAGYETPCVRIDRAYNNNVIVRKHLEERAADRAAQNIAALKWHCEWALHSLMTSQGAVLERTISP